MPGGGPGGRLGRYFPLPLYIQTWYMRIIGRKEGVIDNEM